MTDTPQTPDRRNRYSEAIRDADGWVLDDGQHMIDAVTAVADAEQAELRSEVDRLGDWVRAVTERAKTAETAHDRTHNELAVNEADRVAAVNQTEAHRLALSEALDLGTGAPWDAIHERVQELHRLAAQEQQQECDHSFPDPFPASLDRIGNCRYCDVSYQDAKRQEQQQPGTETPTLPEGEPTESVIYEVVGDWGVDSADSADGARAAVAKWLRAYPKCGAHAQQRIVRDWPDGSEFYGPWTALPDDPAVEGA